MKKIFKVCAISLALALPTVSHALIPVTDYAQIVENKVMSSVEVAEMVKQFNQMVEQVKTAKSQLDTAKMQVDQFRNEAENAKRRLEGVVGYLDDIRQSGLDGDLLGVLDQLANVDVDSFIQDMGLSLPESDNDNVAIKNTLSGMAQEDQAYKALMKRYQDQAEDLRKLKELQKNADTPQKREEFANALAVEAMEQERFTATVEAQKERDRIKKEAQEEVQRAEFMKEQMALPSWMK